MLQSYRSLIIFLVALGCWCWFTPILFAQEPRQGGEEPPRTPVELYQEVDDWSYPHYIKDQLLWSASGKKARIVGQTEFQVKVITITYYIVPPNEAISSKENILLVADEGIIKRLENSTVLKGNIKISKGENLLLTTELNTLYSPENKNLAVSSNEVVTFTNSSLRAEHPESIRDEANPHGMVATKTEPILLVRGKGFKGETNFNRLTWLKEVETVITGSSLFPLSPTTETANSITTITSDGPLSIEKTVENNYTKYIFTYQNNVVLTRKDRASQVPSSEPADPVSAGSGDRPGSKTPKEIVLKADILKILITKDETPSNVTPVRDEVILLKGKKEASFYLAGGVTPNSDESKKVERGAPILITSEGDCCIYEDFQRIVFKNKVHVTSRPVTNNPESRPGQDEAQLTGDTLNLFINRKENEIDRIQAEGNVFLTNEQGQQLSGSFLKWLPAEYRINVKSRLTVKVWSEGSLLSAEEVIIHTARNQTSPWGNWEKIEGPGIIKIHEKP